jgi:spoIIIJ-associated protein
MKSFEASGRSVEEAVNAGLAESGLSIGDVSVEILDEGSKGLFGLFGSRIARVRLVPREEEAQRGTHDLFKNSLSGAPAKRHEASGPATPAPRNAEKPEKRARPAREPQESAPQPQEARPVEVKPARERKPAPRHERTDEAEPKPELPREVKPLIPVKASEAGTPEGITQDFLQQLTGLMGMQINVAVSTQDDGHIYVQLDGDPQGILIGRRGETLDALQYLTSLKVNRGREEYIRVTLDSEGYRQKREEALIRLANRMANRVRKTGRRVNMEPMNPYERRIFHSALQAIPGIATHSEGEEPNRHVVITPVREEGGPDAPQQGESESSV